MTPNYARKQTKLAEIMVFRFGVLFLRSRKDAVNMTVLCGVNVRTSHRYLLNIFVL